MPTSRSQIWVFRVFATATALVIAVTALTVGRALWSEYRVLHLLQNSVENTDEDLYFVGDDGVDRYTVDDAVDAVPTLHRPAAVGLLMNLLENSADSYVRVRALRALERFGPEARDAVPTLTAIVQNDSDLYARLWAIGALKEIGISSTEVIESLTRVLELDAELCDEAAWALGHLKAESAVPSLVAALDRDEIYQTRHLYVIALGEIGPKAGHAVDRLNRIILDEDEYLLFRRDAFEALQRIDAEAATKLLDISGAVAWMKEYPSNRHAN